MYFPERTPSAIVTAALENKKFHGYHVFVEGGGDFKLWRNFMQKLTTKVTICNGCDNVIAATMLGNEKGIRCFGIIDSDFRKILGAEELPNNIFVTDDHDIEMMICHTESLAKVLNNYDSSQKIDDYEASNGSVRDFVLALSNQIGYLKLLHKRKNLNIELKHKNDDNEIVLPSYEKFLSKQCQIKSVEEMIRYLLQWSESHGKRPNKTFEEVVEAYKIESATEQDTWQLSNGHDFVYLLAYVIWKKIGCKRKTRQELESDLVLAYEQEYFKNSSMYSVMNDWFLANNNNNTLFSFPM